MTKPRSVGNGPIAKFDSVDGGSSVNALTVNASTFLRLTPSPSAPATPAVGTVYYDSGLNTLRCWNGTTWNSLF